VQIVKTPKFFESLFPSLVWKKENSEKEIYLTFDDSPTPKFTC
jgi:peptidoglycan/xylan/chitin deacetylase (PgdA/CDA1 family)